MTTKRQTGLQFLPPFEKFQAQFRLAFGRELTREERRFYRMIQIVLEEQDLQTPIAALGASTFPWRKAEN